MFVSCHLLDSEDSDSSHDLRLLDFCSCQKDICSHICLEINYLRMTNLTQQGYFFGPIEVNLSLRGKENNCRLYNVCSLSHPSWGWSKQFLFFPSYILLTLVASFALLLIRLQEAYM